jgi:protein gp37
VGKPGARTCAVESWPLPNVWLGVSTERQQEADERIPLLLQTPAAVRFISAEPLLGPIDLRKLGDITMSLNAFTGHASHLLGMKAKTLGTLDWAIAGGESGPGARPMHPDWARGLRDQCGAAGVPFFFKQWGNHVHATQCDLTGGDPWTEVWIDDLDGKEHNAFPEAKEVAFA